MQNFDNQKKQHEGKKETFFLLMYPVRHMIQFL